MRFLVVLFVAVGLWLGQTQTARACAVCSTGSPTLTSSGSEKPYDGRLRTNLDVRAGGASTGVGDRMVVLSDRRLELGMSYAPMRAFMVGAFAPVLYRSLKTTQSGRDAVVMGDVDLRASNTAWESESRTRRFTLVGGLKLPTAPIQRDGQDRPLSAELQPGCGSVVPYVGADYTWSFGKWTLGTGASVFLPVPVRDGPHPGYSARARVMTQFQPWPAFAVRLGAMSRFDATGALRAGEADPNSGGIVGYVNPGVAVSPVTDLVISAEAFIPAAQALRGVHRENPIYALAIAYDFR